MKWSTPTPTAMAVWMIAGTLGCSGEPSPQPPSDAATTPRIVSLSPALSKTLLDLGLGDLVVGRTAYCESLDPAIPVVGDLYELDYERLIRLDPTHVLVQPASARGLEPRLVQLADERGWTVADWTINTIEDVQLVIATIPTTLYAHEDPRWAEVHERAGGLIIGMAMSLAPEVGALWQGRTLLVADTDPVWVFGQGTYLDDMLTLLGAENATEARGWAELSLEDVARLDPQAIIIVRDRGPADVDPLEAAGPLATLQTSAARDGRIRVLFHRDAKLPSSGLTGVADALRTVLRDLNGS